MSMCTEALLNDANGMASPSSASSGPRSANFGSPVYFALIAPRAGAQDDLFEMLQAVIVAPMVGKRSLSEFRVLSATPPSFVADACTLLVFELVVPSPRAITDIEVRGWRLALGPDARLLVATPPTSRSQDLWDTVRARSVLARAMALGGEERATKPKRKCNGSLAQTFSTAAKTCFQRGDEQHETPVLTGQSPELPVLCAVDIETGRLSRLPSGATLMSEAIAAALSQYLPASIQWRRTWRLSYSPRVHGVSLQTFYRNMSAEGPSILLLQDHRGRVFGAYVPVQWRIVDRYYGTGESFVFRLRRRMPKALRVNHANMAGEAAREQRDAPSDTTNTDSPPVDKLEAAAQAIVSRTVETMQKWSRERDADAQRSARLVAKKAAITSPTEALDEVLCQFGNGTGPTQEKKVPDIDEDEDEDDALLGAMHDSDPDLDIFNWSTGDAYFIFSDAECLAIGGGSAFALYIEKDLLHGMSEPSSTYNSVMLSSSQNFAINGFECWVFDDPAENHTL